MALQAIYQSVQEEGAIFLRGSSMLTVKKTRSKSATGFRRMGRWGNGWGHGTGTPRRITEPCCRPYHTWVEITSSSTPRGRSGKDMWGIRLREKSSSLALSVKWWPNKESNPSLFPPQFRNFCAVGDVFSDLHRSRLLLSSLLLHSLDCLGLARRWTQRGDIHRSCVFLKHWLSTEINPTFIDLSQKGSQSKNSLQYSMSR